MIRKKLEENTETTTSLIAGYWLVCYDKINDLFELNVWHNPNPIC